MPLASTVARRTATIVLACFLIVGCSTDHKKPKLPPEITPTPVGVTSNYRISAHGAATLRGMPAGKFVCKPTSTLRTKLRVHFELYADDLVVVIPTGIGTHSSVVYQSRITASACAYQMRTLDPSGVIYMTDETWTLGDFFAVWGQPLIGRRIANFIPKKRSSVALHVNGKRVSGDPAQLVLRNGDNIVLQVNSSIKPHKKYTFPDVD